MPKQRQIDKAILILREGGEIKMFFSELHWFLQVVERYKLGFDLEFNTKISMGEVTLKGIIK